MGQKVIAEVVVDETTGETITVSGDSQEEVAAKIDALLGEPEPAN